VRVKALDYENPIAVLRDIYWVGFYDQEADLHCNPYLIIDDEEVLLFDPGSIPHFSVVMRKVIDVINPEEITHVVLSHQDPDVCGNIAVVEDLIGRDDLKLVNHSSLTRLVQHYGVKSPFYEVDKNGGKLELKSGRVLEFLHTPFLHSPFGIVTYDHESKSLFSSDIFGGLSDHWSLFASEDAAFESMSRWHQLIIPSNRVLKDFLQKLERFDIQRILPQHGSILEGSFVPRAIEHLRNLPCGIDLTGGTLP